jgi:restriction system protein
MGRGSGDALASKQEREVKRQAQEEKRQLAIRKQATIEEKVRQAEARTRNAAAKLDEVQTVLQQALQPHAVIAWESPGETSDFPEREPNPEPLLPIPPAPDEQAPKYRVRSGLMGSVFGTVKRQHEDEARSRFEQDMKGWRILQETIAIQNRDIEKRNRERLQSWERRKGAFESRRLSSNRMIEDRQAACGERDPAAVEEFCQLVLLKSRYPAWCPRKSTFDYNPGTGVLVIDHRLPSRDDLPRVKEVRYIKARDEFAVVPCKDAEIDREYDNLVYQIVLRTLHELFTADSTDALASIALNGYVHAVDPTTGRDVAPCIVSVHTEKKAFLEINLAKVDPKACFKALKGAGSSKLASLSPVMPLVVMTKDDRRFVEGKDVIEGVESSTNLAAMDWEDFEHLIRQVFEQEFTRSGGEVKVTRASRDGGVDAIAFDPDPIRGGKIVIQAKRYTNTVGVSAVRDLYGTLMNEGATKGILVTTSDYGPDAYEFAKGKPITLLNGGNLLYLLEKHGQRARIDLQAAKRENVNKKP